MTVISIVPDYLSIACEELRDCCINNLRLPVNCMIIICREELNEGAEQPSVSIRCCPIYALDLAVDGVFQLFRS